MQLGGSSYRSAQNPSDFIVAYPAGMWDGPYSWSQYANIEFFDAMITEISENLCVNRDAVFSVGHSLWSYMSNKVSCQRGDVIRAMAWVASDGFNGDCSWPVASLITHLPGDLLASYSWGERAYSIRSDVNQCWSSEESTSLWDIKSCSEKLSCTPWNTVLFCNSYATYWNDQHSWPKNGSDDILNFFRDVDDYN
jgi:polyhydroxybutyrate depolymerase